MKRLFLLSLKGVFFKNMAYRGAVFVANELYLQQRSLPRQFNSSLPPQSGNSERSGRRLDEGTLRGQVPRQPQRRIGENSTPFAGISGNRDMRPRNEGNGGGRGSREERLESIAPVLVDLKRQYKKAKSSKERRELTRDARRLVRRVQIDPSTQDEKSMSILLNSVVVFHCFPGENIEQAVQWMRKNIAGLSPQNVGLFANALGSIELQDADVILLDEVAPVVETIFKDMTPVEIVMVLQAFQRQRIYSNQELQERLLQQLAPCFSKMPISQLSTLATVLSRHPLKKKDECQWQLLVDSILEKVLGDIDHMHSKEVITFLTAAPFLQVSQSQLIQLLVRATATARFHTDEQVGQLFHAMANIRKKVESPTEDLMRAGRELQEALLTRLERVAQFANLSNIAAIWKYSRYCEAEIPPSVQERLSESVLRNLVYERLRFAVLSRLVKAAEAQKLPSNLFEVISDCCIGKRPSPPGRGHLSALEDDTDVDEVPTRAYLYGRFFANLVSLRLHLESAFSTNRTAAPTSLTLTLPQELLAHAAEASPRQTLKAVEYIALAPACTLRNDVNDRALLSFIEGRIKQEGEKFTKNISLPFLTRVTTALSNNPKTQSIMKLLLPCTQ